MLSLFLSETLLAKWFDPRHAQMEANKKLYELALKVDSLAIEVDRKDKFIMNFQRILSGDTSSEFVDPAQTLAAERPVKVMGSMNPAPSDSAFKKEFEKSQLANVSLTSSKYHEL